MPFPTPSELLSHGENSDEWMKEFVENINQYENGEDDEPGEDHLDKLLEMHEYQRTEDLCNK